MAYVAASLFLVLVAGSLVFQARPGRAFSIDAWSTLLPLWNGDPAVGNHEQITRVAITSAKAPNGTTPLDQPDELDTVIVNLNRGVENTDITHQFDCDSHMDDSSVAPLPDPPGVAIPPGESAGWWNRKYNCDGQGFQAAFSLLWDRLNHGVTSASGNQQFLHPTFSTFRDIVQSTVTLFQGMATSPGCAAHPGCALAAAQAQAYAQDYTPTDVQAALLANPSPDPFPVTNPDSVMASNVPASLQPCGPCGLLGVPMEGYRSLVYGLQQDLHILLDVRNNDPFCSCQRTLDEMLGSSDPTVLQLHDALDKVNAYLAFQYVGHALHTTEDFFAHSNYIELIASALEGVTIDPGLFGGGGIGVTGLPAADMQGLVPQDYSQFTYNGMQSYMVGRGANWNALQTGAIYGNLLGEGDFCLSSHDHFYNATGLLGLALSLLTGTVPSTNPGSNPNPPYGFNFCHYNTTTTMGLNKDESDVSNPSTSADPCLPPATVDLSKLEEPEHVNFFYACNAGQKMAAELWTYVRNHLGPTTAANSSSSVDSSGQQHIDVHLKAEDTSGHNVGVQKIDWYLTGAQTGSGSIASAEGDVDISAPGTTVLHFRGTDGNGTVEPEKRYAVTTASPSSPSYSYDLIAKTGDPANVPSVSDTFTAFGTGPSMNDVGTVAFSASHQGTSSAGNGLFVKRGGEPVADVNPSYSLDGSRRFSDDPQINMSDEIIAGDVLSGSPPFYKIRVWDGRIGVANRFQTLDSSGSITNCSANSILDPTTGLPLESGTIVDPTTGASSIWTPAGVNGYGVGNLPNFPPGATCEGSSHGYSSVVAPGLNNKGDYIYSGFDGASWAIDGTAGPVATLHSFFKPLITDSGAIVTRAGGVDGNPALGITPDPIVLYGSGGAETIACATGCGHPGFAKLGPAPGASGDGQIVVFEGDYEGSNAAFGHPGPGIFAMIKTNSNGWVVERIASVGDAQITSFDTVARVGVQSTQAGKRAVSIVFTAYGPSGGRGIYVSQLHFLGSDDGTFNVNQPTHGFAVDTPQLIAEVGSGIPGLGAITSLSYGTAPINNHGVGDIAFWVAIGSQQAIVRARPKCDGTYTPGTLATSTYINGFDAGPLWNLPVAGSSGLRGGNACGPASVAMAWNLVKHARSKATSDGAMADLSAMYGTGANKSGMMLKVVSGHFVNGIIHNGDRAGWSGVKAQAYLASKGWVSTLGEGKSFIDQQLDAGNLVVASTTFGVGAQPVAAHSAYGAGHIVLLLGRTPNGDYIVDDPAGDFYSNPGHAGIGAHYGPGICGEAVVYAQDDVARNLVVRDSSGNPVDANGNATTVGAAKGRQALAISYKQDADPEVLVVTGFFSGSNGRPYRLSLTNSAGQSTGFLPSGTTTDIAGSFAALDQGSPDDVTEPTAQAIGVENFVYTVTVVNPGTDLTTQIQGTASGNYTIEYTRIKDGVTIDQATVTGTISAGATRSVPVARSPVATAQDLSARQETPHTVQLAGTDLDGRSLTFAVATQPAHGTLSAVDATGKVVYTPAAGYTGPDNFTFTASNGVIVSKPATVAITVHPNTPPVAVDGSVSTDENQAVQIPLNGSAPSGQPLTFAVGQAPNGTVTLTGTTATYTPKRYFFGTDSFTFTVDDGYLTSAPATVAITVRHVNQPPVVTLTAPQSVNEGAPAVPITATVMDPDGDAVTLEWTNSLGRLTANGTSATFSADDGPATAMVSLIATDGENAAGTGQAAIVVKNVSPSVSAGLSQSQYWGLPVFFVGAATDPSPVDQTAGLNPSWSFGDGQSSTVASTVHAYAKPGSYSARFSATDKDGGTGSASVAVTVAKRGGALAYTGAASAPYGFLVLQARLTDSVDAGSALLAGHSVVFVLGSQSYVATTDGSGVATVMPSPVAPGSYPLAVSLANDIYYNASAARAMVTVTRSQGRVAGTGLMLSGGASASLSVSSTSVGVTGTLSYSSPSLSLTATSLNPLGIRSDGHAAWLNGVDSTGRKLVVYAEDNGPSGATDVFKLWVNGTLVTGTGGLAGGDVAISSG